MFEHESDFWYWPKGAPRPIGPGTDAEQVLAYASTGLAYLRYNDQPCDFPMAMHCALTIMGLEANAA